MAWSCCSVSRCECRIDADVTDMSVFKKLNVESASRPLIVEEMHREWTNLVSEFTRRKLTKIKDRLPAISGLAKLCGEVTSSKYYAGLFEHDLEYSLLWMSDYDAQSFLIYRNPERPDMPTWSWASTTGPVKYFDRQRNQFERRTHGATVEPRFKVLEAEVSSRGPNEYSDVESGMIKIKGQLLRVHYDKTTCHFRPWDETLASHMLPSDIPFNSTDLQTQDTTTASVSQILPSPSPSKPQTLQLPQKAKTRQPQLIPDVLSEPSRSEDWYFLRAARYIPGGIYTYESSENVCLLLEKVREGVFRRRGLVLYGWASRPFWEEEWAPMQVFETV